MLTSVSLYDYSYGDRSIGHTQVYLNYQNLNGASFVIVIEIINYFIDAAVSTITEYSNTPNKIFLKTILYSLLIWVAVWQLRHFLYFVMRQRYFDFKIAGYKLCETLYLSTLVPVKKNVAANIFVMKTRKLWIQMQFGMR